MDMTRKNEVGVDTKPHIETVTQASSTDDMETILQQLSAELEVTTEDGYTGTLQLDHTTVKVTVDGYATKTQALSASRSYPNLSEADVSLIPKSIEENGKTPCAPFSYIWNSVGTPALRRALTNSREFSTGTD